MRPEVQIALEAGAVSIVEAFGVRAQMIQACEELGELTTALCKNLNNKPGDSLERVADEVADVLIMAYQMRHVFNIGGRVDDRIVKKLSRTMDRIRDRNIAKEEGAGLA